MSNVLRVTTPLTNYDNTIQPRTEAGGKTPDAKIQGPAVPDQVVRPDARSDSAAQEQNVGLKFQYQSNFEGFIAQMRESGTVTEEFATVLFEQLGNLVKSGMGEDTAQELGQFLQMIQLNPQDMLSFLQEQGSSSVRFQGAFFSLLRQAMNETQNVELRAGILEFVKRYTDMAEGEHILNQMEQTMEKIKDSMFKSGREQMDEMMRQMEFGGAGGRGETLQNASVVKNQMLPYLNQYIASTHDRGNVRENAAFLAALAARYENGGAERVLEQFEKLMEYPLMQKLFKGFGSEDLMRALETTDFEKALERNDWMKQFADMIRDGMENGANIEQKQVFRNMMTSILLNESVYMPVLHMMMPMQVEDKLMFAEMWVDPDAGKETGQEEEEQVVQGLVKFDIQDVGFFDLFFVYQGGKVNIQLNCPEEISKNEDEIRNELAEILTRNGLEAEELFVGSSKESIAISEAFPQIFERRNSINVQI